MSGSRLDAVNDAFPALGVVNDAFPALGAVNDAFPALGVSAVGQERSEP
jgi:hypothetical protein